MARLTAAHQCSTLLGTRGCRFQREAVELDCTYARSRCARVGVTLKEIPEVLQTQAKAGSAEANAAVKNIQTHNQQLVSRAEKRANKK